MCRKWCELNQLMPEIEYIDMVDRMNTSQYFGKVKGKTERVPLPVGAPLDLYISGFSCKDNSLTNRHRQPVVTTSKDGESSQTLDASIKTILAMFPKFALLENPNGCPKEVSNYLQSKLGPHYHVGVFKLNTMDLGLDTSKPRKWFCAQRVDAIADGMHLNTWPSKLEKFLSTAGPVVDTSKFLLSRDCKLVKDYFKELQETATKMQSKEKQVITTTSTEPAPKWKKTHETARAEFKKLGLDIPAPERGLGVVQALSHTDGWAPLYAEREHDLITILQEQAAHFGTDWMSKHLHWDISAPSDHSFPIAGCDAGKVGCLLTQHKIYNSALERHLLAVEHLLQAGFPLSKVSNQTKNKVK